MELKNKETEQLCERISDLYWSEGHLHAMNTFNEWLAKNPTCKIEYIIIVERIKDLVLVKKPKKSTK